MSRRGKYRWLLLVLLAAVVLVWFQQLSPQVEPESSRSTEASRDAAPPASPEVPSSLETAPASGRAVLPAVDAPLATIIAPLVERADAGDAWAACRLAMELIRCRHVNHLSSIQGYMENETEATFQAKGDLETADRIALGKLTMLERVIECRAVPAELRDRAGHYLTQAARAGVPEAMVRYAEGQHWPYDGRGVFSDPGFDAWRRDAPAMMHRAFEAGVPEAPLFLMNAYQFSYVGLGAFIPNDPVKAEAIHKLMVRLHGWQDRSAHSRLSAEDQASATRMAETWHLGPFKGRNYRGQGRAMFSFAGIPREGGQPQEFCSGEALVP